MMVEAEGGASEAAEDIEVGSFGGEGQGGGGERGLAIESGAAHDGAEEEVGYGFQGEFSLSEGGLRSGKILNHGEHRGYTGTDVGQPGRNLEGVGGLGGGHGHDGRRPFADGMHGATIGAVGCRELGSAVGTGGVGLEGVEGLATAAALPVVADGGTGLAGGAGVSEAARQFGEAQEGAGVLESAPAIEKKEEGHDAVPERLRPNRETDERDDAHQAKNSGDMQTAGA